MRILPSVYRAGWPDRRNARFGWCWVWVRNYIIGWNLP